MISLVPSCSLRSDAPPPLPPSPPPPSSPGGISGCKTKCFWGAQSKHGFWGDNVAGCTTSGDVTVSPSGYLLRWRLAAKPLKAHKGTIMRAFVSSIIHTLGLTPSESSVERFVPKIYRRGVCLLFIGYPRG